MSEYSYAQEICRGLTGGNADLVRQAFAEVRKEDFLFAPPWTAIGSYPGWAGGIRKTSHVRDLYHDVLIALLPDENINTGQPSMWAGIFHWSDLRPGMRVFQSGAGLGYFTAILAHIVGAQGRVWYEEPHPLLTRKCADNLAPFPNVARTYGGEALDRIYVCYGTTSIAGLLLDRLVVNGRAIVPLTDEQGQGRFISITRTQHGALVEAGSACAFIKSKDYKPSRDIRRIASLESIVVSQDCLASATENGEVDLVRAIFSTAEHR